MAKDLPFFKFKTSEWNDGNIVDCSLEAQGLFINICSLYWSREGELDNATVKRKLCHGNAKAYKELISAKIIKISGEEISIAFLDEQLGECKGVSDMNREKALKRWKKDAPVLPEHSNGNANGMPIDKIRQDKIREEERFASQIAKILNKPYQGIADRGTEGTGQDVDALILQLKKNFNLENSQIESQVKSMKEAYQKNGWTFPSNYMTLLNSLTETNWIERLKDLNPERVAENIGKQKVYEPTTDTIGTSAPGSLG